MNEQWTESEVFQVMGDTRLDNIEGVGPIRMEIFAAANLEYVRTVRDLTDDQVEDILKDAADKLVQHHAGGLDHWHRRVGMCMAVIKKLRYPEASSFVPEHLACPITCQLMEHPVVTSTGQTYERDAIVSFIGSKLITGHPPVDHFNSPIRILREASTPIVPADYIVSNYALKKAAAFYERHSMRFNILLKAPYRT